ncbi:MAG: CDP-diacylglycerol--glycerol-3-phosphate 3-phosphatidyltransferase [bacterium]
MTLPNKLTLIRICLVPAFVAFMFFNDVYTRIIALLIFVIASLTDLYDGILARRYQCVTDFGRFMDPLADKLLICSAFISFISLKELNIFTAAPMVTIIISREFIITGLRGVAARKGQVIAADKTGKFKTTSQIVVIIVTMLILITNAWLKKNYGLVHSDLLLREGWQYYMGLFLQEMPFYLLFLATVMTVISGLNFIFKNKRILIEGI